MEPPRYIQVYAQIAVVIIAILIIYSILKYLIEKLFSLF
jgi:hypothetical protein